MNILRIEDNITGSRFMFYNDYSIWFMYILQLYIYAFTMFKLASVYNDERVNAKGVLHSLSTNEFIEEYQQYNTIW